MDNLRILRNKITYDWFFVKEEYIKRKEGDILKLIHKLNKIINEKIK